MRRHAIILAALLSIVAMPLATAENGRPGGRPGNGHPGNRPEVPRREAGRASHGFQPSVSWYWPRTVIAVNPWSSYYGYGYSDYPNYGYPYSYYGSNYPYYGYGYGYGYIPPVTIPAESLFGIGPIQRLMGVNNVPNPPVRAARPIIEPPAPDRPQSDLLDAKQKAVEAQAAVAQRYLDMGDVQFADGKYVTAIARYRRATTAAPRDAEAQFRLGFAFLATEQYDLAVKAMKRGLKLDPTWPNLGFRLRSLYGNDDGAKASHLEAMAKAAEEHPENGDLLFLIGVFLYSDGQAERAQPFFTRAAQLEQVDRAPIDAFLKAAQ